MIRDSVNLQPSVLNILCGMNVIFAGLLAWVKNSENSREDGMSSANHHTKRKLSRNTSKIRELRN